MARMYSKRKGRSGSTKPSVDKKKTWVRYSVKEIESLILKLAKLGNSSSKIGLILRDTYGVPDIKLYSQKSITRILEANKLGTELPEDLLALIKREIALMKHLETNKKDMSAKRGLQLTGSKINRLGKYYKKTGRLEATWKYDRERAKLLIG